MMKRGFFFSPPYGLSKGYQKRNRSKGKCPFCKLLVEYYVSEMMIQRVVNGKLPFFFSNNFLTKTK